MFRNAQAMTLPYGGRSWPDRTTLYDFKKLPETEALADALNYVCETNNASTGGNETGVGGGLSGADLVLYQAGTLPGAVGGWRTVTDRAVMALQATATFLSTFLQNAAGFSALWKLRNINTTGATSGSPALFYLYEDAAKVNCVYFRGAHFYACSGGISGEDAKAVNVLPPVNRIDLNAGLDVPVYLLSSVDYAKGLAFSGLSWGKQPSTLADCATYSISQPKSPITAPSGLAWTNAVYRSVIGAGGAYIANGCDIASITFAKYPSVTLK